MIYPSSPMWSWTIYFLSMRGHAKFQWTITAPCTRSRGVFKKTVSPGFLSISKFSKSWPKNCTIVWFYLRDFAVSLNLSQCPLWKPIRQVQSFCSKSSSEGLCCYMEPHLTILKVSCYICCLTTETFLPHAAQERSLDCSRAVWSISSSLRYGGMFRISKCCSRCFPQLKIRICRREHYSC